MSDDGVLLVIGSGLRYYREYLVESVHRRAVAAGLRTVLLNNLTPTWQTRYFDEITVADVFDPAVMAATARAVAARHRVVGLLCWDEPLVLTAGELAAEFGVPGLGLGGVHACRDKHRTRALLTAAGLPQPGFAMPADLAEARAAADDIGYPVVVKPRALGASIGVVLAHDPGEFDAAYAVASSASAVDQGVYGARVIVEGYADGPEVSVDGAVHKGEYTPMFLARKHSGEAPYFEEVGHVVDAADPLLADDALTDTLTRAHAALGVEDGVTHAEVRLTARGPVVIEVNGRVGGDLIPLLGRVATGIDSGEVLFDVATGRRPELTPTRRAVAGIRFGVPDHDCVVRSVAVPADAPGLVTAGPMVEPGTTLRLPPGGYLARHSFVVCAADDPPTCEQRLDEAAARVVVTADPVDPPERGAVFEMPAGLLDTDA
ncbi:ATP-grasp domain-containing protein [Saccharothrix variisporea]|uniref:ATP-grasp domain-containing protein n=1 Tax=Saccharothrix variisporea TaxID=543527 RepID=A0A495XL71_9PSEU|nr:ATP-grasp domain-containing protein [Saccharothrix variisporea]RKT74632.1 ATP-grasp domain-containing protein [Saccharothrix variisporea]